MEAVSFGRFQLFPGQRLLTEDGKRVRLGGRAFDVLVALVERRGEIIGHEELRERVWRDATVDEGSLRVQMSALRKVLGERSLGEGYIRNEPGRGYCFVAPVSTQREPPEETPARAAVPGWTPAPPPRLTRTIGREVFVDNIAARLPVSRFVTITGAGGVGKTTVAVEVGERLVESYPHGACFADLASLQSPALVPSAIASLVGLGVYSDPMVGLKAFLRDRHMLILLDNCEHVIDAVAALAEEIIAAARNVHILATSREPLRAAGEWVHRLPPLEQPPAAAALTAQAALAFPAMQLFVERALASNSDFQLTDQNSEMASELCRRLEGIPLAIELAAARVDEFGLRGLAARLGERFSLMMKGRRTALPRHKTLRGTLDWSYELLAEEEKTTLRRIAVFAGGFHYDSAVAVGAFGELAPLDVQETMANLVAKSLVSVDVSGDLERYRLFHMTRHYAREKLESTEEHMEVRRRHAEHLGTCFEKAETDWERLTAAQWKLAYNPFIDDIRDALEWAFSPEGDATVGIRLTALTSLLWTQLGLMVEHRSLVERALQSNAASATPDPRLELRLTAALGSLLFHTKGPLVDGETNAAFERCVALAEQLGDQAYRLRALTGWCALRIMRGSYPEALTFVEKFDPSVTNANNPAVNRTLAHNLHYMGDFVRARRYLDAALATADDSGRVRSSSGVQYDHRVTVHTILARTLWLTGRPDSALEVARECVEDAISIDHVVSLCLTLSTSACPLAFVIGGRAAALPYLHLLRETAIKNSMIRWQYWADAYDIAMTSREERRASTTLEARMRQLAESPIDGPQLENLAIFGDAYTDERLVERASRGFGGWCAAEMLRCRGELSLRRDGDPAPAERLFRESLAHARQTGARAWELRAATSLARLLRTSGGGKAVLAPVVDAFTEGRESVDVRRAVELLRELE